MLRRSVFAASCVVMLVALSGCGGKGSHLKTVAAGGTVTHNGKPVEGATVNFFPADPNSGKAAGGTTDAAGKFTLQTFVGGTTTANGALVGDYKVTVAKFSGQDDHTPLPGMAPLSADAPATPEDMTKQNQDMAEQMSKMKEGMDKQMADFAKGGKAPPPTASNSLLPAKYADVKTSDLKESVPAGGRTDFAFDLKDD